MDTLAQIAIVVFGGLAVWLVGRIDRWQRWGYIAGLASQPAWFYIGIKTGQWAIIAMNVWYTYAWAKGAYNHWLKAPQPQPQPAPLPEEPLGDLAPEDLPPFLKRQAD